MERLKTFLPGFMLAVCVIGQSAPALAQSTKAQSARPIGKFGDWFPQSSMPAESVARGEVGAVVAKLSVDADGTVAECSVVKSSCYPLLDAAACERAKAVGRFNPARDENGLPMASTFTLPELHYVLSKEHLSAATVDAKRKVYNSTIQIDVGNDGIVQTCRSLNSDTSDRNACGAYISGQPAPSVFRSSSGSKVTISNTIVVDQNGNR